MRHFPYPLRHPRAVLPLVIVFFLLLPTVAAAFPNEPTQGYEDLPWGRRINLCYDMEFFNVMGQTRLYTRLHNRRFPARAEVTRALYGFNEGRFFFVALSFESEEDYRLVSDYLRKQHGPSDSAGKGDETQVWEGSKVLITLKHEPKTLKTTLTYHYIPIALESAGEAGR